MLDYLCIYCPELDTGHIENQLVYYYSQVETSLESKLKHIGLSQGVIELGKDFSSGKNAHVIETVKSRIVMKEIENGSNWWLVACIKFPQVSGDKKTEFYSGDVPPAELLIAEIYNAYKHWRLQHGPITTYKDRIQQLRDVLSEWWFPWADNWNIKLHGAGVLGLFTDSIRTARGNLTPTTVEVIERVLSNESDDLVDLVITRHDEDLVENDGCVWRSQHEISTESIADLVGWIRACNNPGTQSSFDTKVPSSVKQDTGLFPSSLQESAAAVKALGEAMTSAAYFPILKMSEWTAEVMGSKEKTVEKDDPTDFISDSVYLVGLDGSLEDGTSEETLESERAIKKRRVFLKKADGEISEYNLVIYRRRPFIFTLIYKVDTANLDNESYYKSLHLRLASLSEPIFKDVTELCQNRVLNFYYMVIDSPSNTVITTLPDIPAIEDEAENKILHLHQSIAQLILSVKSTGSESFARTDKGWWLYWTRLPDDRQVIFARKQGKRKKDKGESFISALGTDAKVWLDDYKYNGRV